MTIGRLRVAAAVLGATAMTMAGTTALAAPAASGTGAGQASVPAAGPAAAAYARMSERQRVGQLFLTGVSSTGVTDRELRQLRGSAGGNVFLRDHSRRGRARYLRVVGRADRSTTVAGVRPFVATDQEGGEVQTLAGPGFSAMPTALTQGRWVPARLRAAARTWGRQLRHAGVDLNLAPVADTVPAAVGIRNQPIGRYYREYGHRVQRVGTHVVSVVRGMTDAGVATAVKHFPGLGRATGNTDLGPNVTDPTRRHDPFLRPFRRAIAAGTQFVMVSSARYPHIDRTRRACFSPVVIGSLLRRHEGFRGIVVSDSFASAGVHYLPRGPRAVNFFRAGGTMLLDTTTSDLHAMTRAVLARVAHNRRFARLIAADVMLVLRTKAADGLIHS